MPALGIRLKCPLSVQFAGPYGLPVRIFGNGRKAGRARIIGSGIDVHHLAGIAVFHPSRRRSNERLRILDVRRIGGRVGQRLQRDGVFRKPGLPAICGHRDRRTVGGNLCRRPAGGSLRRRSRSAQREQQRRRQQREHDGDRGGLTGKAQRAEAAGRLGRRRRRPERFFARGQRQTLDLPKCFTDFTVFHTAFSLPYPAAGHSARSFSIARW